MKKEMVVVFDDRCPTCATGKRFAESFDQDKRIDFVGMNTERGKALIQERGLDMGRSAYALHADGSTAEKSHMVRDVLARNGLVGFFLSLPFRIPHIGDTLYTVLALHRRHTTKSGSDTDQQAR